MHKYWVVIVNNNQRQYVIDAPTCVQAITMATEIWRMNDDKVTARQKARGIYDIRARLAKFSEIMNNTTFTVPA